MTEAIEVTSHQLRLDGRTIISMDLYRSQARDTVVIICPGFFQSKGTRTFRRLSRALAEDYDVLTLDFRGHGRSTGLYTFSAEEGAELEAALVWAAERYRRIGVLGFSLGAAVAINVLAHQPRAASSLIAVSAPSSFDEIEFRFWTPAALWTGLRGLDWGAGCRPGLPLQPKERPVEAIGRLRGLPVLFIHGSRDVIVGPQHSQRLYDAASKPKKLELIEGGDHAEALFRDDPERFTDLVRTWFARTLSAATTDRGIVPNG